MARITFVACATVMYGLAAGLMAPAACGDLRTPALQPRTGSPSQRIVLRTVSPSAPAVRTAEATSVAAPLSGPAINTPTTSLSVGPVDVLPTPVVQRIPPIEAMTSPEHGASVAIYPQIRSDQAAIDSRFDVTDDAAQPIDLSGEMWPAFLDEGMERVARLAEGPCLTAPCINAPADLQTALASSESEPRVGIPSEVVGSVLLDTANKEPPLATLTPADVDWQRDPSLGAVSLQADALLERAFSLAEKGALYSARAEFFQALQTISKALDARRGAASHSAALSEGAQALREAQDFVAGGTLVAADVNIQAVVARHRTPICRGNDVSGMPAVVAMQRYFAYAEERLTTACAGAPAASRAFYGLGKTYVVIAEQTPTGERLSAPQAMVFHKIALAIDSRNYRAANELGVLLARFGQLPEARATLLQSVAVSPMPETWHNLAVVHERLGERDLAMRARNELQLTRQSVASQPSPMSSAVRPFVQWVDPVMFAQAPERGSSWGTSPIAPPTRAAATVNGVWPR